MDNSSQEISKSLINNIDGKFLELVYKDLAQPSVQKVGKALSTVFGLGNTVLLPIKMLNEKAQTNYSIHMENYRKKLKNIPDSKIIGVQPEIGVPVLDKLEYTTNDKLGELYLNLLANASNIDTVTNTHPSYVNIISNLSPDEIIILEHFNADDSLDKRVLHLTLKINFKMSHQNKQMIDSKKINQYYTHFERPGLLLLPQKAKMYFENLIGLGLMVRTTNRVHVTDEFNYNLLAKDLEGEIENFTLEPNYSGFAYNKGYYRISILGKNFIRACKNATQ